MRAFLLLGLLLPAVAGAQSMSIPLTFHVLTFDDGTGDVPDALLDEQLVVINETFAGTDYVFDLVSVTRTANSEWANFGYDDDFEAVGAALAIDPTTRVNVYYYANTTDGAIGHVVEVDRWPADDTRNGVFMDQGTLPGGQYENFNQGRLVASLLATYLGLTPIYPGCGAQDGVDDTPRYPTFAFGCQAAEDFGTCSGDSAPAEVLVDNLMRLGNVDACLLTLTPGQTTYLTERVQTFWPDLGVAVAGEPLPVSAALRLGAPTPNPSTSRARVAVQSLDREGRAVLTDALGRTVASYRLAPGESEVTVDSASLPPGTYALTVQAGGHVAVRLLTIAR